jgi:hypothetical protein
MLVDVGRRDSLDNALTGGVRPLGSMLRAVGNLLICCKHTLVLLDLHRVTACLQTTTCDVVESYKLWWHCSSQLYHRSCLLRQCILLIGNAKMNKQLYSDSVNHSNSIGGS